MLKSMTGFGRVVKETADKTFTIEIRSLNSKQIDISCKLPFQYKEKELEIRNLVASKLLRGKIEISLYIDVMSAENTPDINSAAFKHYYNQLTEISNELEIFDQNALLSSILRFPDILKSEKNSLDENEWKIVENEITKTISDIDDFRMQEGTAMQQDIEKRIGKIEEYLENIKEFEQDRITRIKDRIKENLKETLGFENIDQNRFEQEVIYFLEKLDITEEKTRLSNHCEYFRDVMRNEYPAGKKLGFVTQEIGREINTIGSKANDSDIQKLVIKMKDELEKIKEQMMNVL